MINQPPPDTAKVRRLFAFSLDWNILPAAYAKLHKVEKILDVL